MAFVMFHFKDQSLSLYPRRKQRNWTLTLNMPGLLRVLALLQIEDRDSTQLPAVILDFDIQPREPVHLFTIPRAREWGVRRTSRTRLCSPRHRHTQHHCHYYVSSNFHFVPPRLLVLSPTRWPPGFLPTPWSPLRTTAQSPSILAP